MLAVNTKNNKIIAQNLKIADTFIKRLIGLMGKNHFYKGEALLITPCNFIHTFFMRFPIDVVFLDKYDYVIKTVTNLKPYRISPFVKGAYKVLELPEGTVLNAQIEKGDKILFLKDRRE